jgi:general secretion pathway protein A
MYNQFFGLRKNPFNMTPDPAFLFFTAQHREALAGLTYGVMERKGFIVLSGDVGTGKTTLLMRVLQSLPPNRVQSSLIVNPTLSAAEFLESALLDFGISDVPASKAQRLVRLQDLLLQGYREGRVSTLIIDEAHKLSVEVLEEIRLLGNFERADQKLLQIVLIGQIELDNLLNRDDLRQLRQRIALRLSIKGLSANEIEPYIRYRWLQAGGRNPLPFSRSAIGKIGECSGGIPRVVNAVCDNALTLAFADGSTSVTDNHAATAAADLKLTATSKSRGSEPAETAMNEIAPPIKETFPLRTIEQYGGTRARRPSWVARWAEKFANGATSK